MIDFTELKKIYAQSMDMLLSENGLTVPCLLKYSDNGKDTICPNCVFDPISRLSSNRYNGTGPISFASGMICPVCKGEGTVKGSAKTETINIAAIFDHKYFINLSSQQKINIPEGTVQTICDIELLGKILKSNSIIIDSSLINHSSYEYRRAGDPQPGGLGENRYITTLWNRKS